MLVIGAYAEYVRVSRHMLVEKPSNWSWELAAAIPEVSLFQDLSYKFSDLGVG